MTLVTVFWLLIGISSLVLMTIRFGIKKYLFLSPYRQFIVKLEGIHKEQY